MSRSGFPLRPWLIIFHFLVCSTCFGQVIIEALPRWMVTGQLCYQISREPIRRFLDNDQAGYELEIFYRLQYNKPILAGAYFSEFGLSKYALTYIQPSGNGDIEIREKANTRRLEGGLCAGFFPEINWLIQPYVVGKAGLAIFQTSSILTDNDSHESLERISESTTYAPAYGLDVGIHIIPNIWYIRGDLRFGISGNTSTDYLLLNEEDAGTTGVPIDYFDTYRSAGRWLKISAGISYLF